MWRAWRNTACGGPPANLLYFDPATAANAILHTGPDLGYTDATAALASAVANHFCVAQALDAGDPDSARFHSPPLLQSR